MILSQLAGIHPQDVKTSATTSLEHLLQLGDKILKEPEFKEFQDYLKARKNYENKAGKIIYDAGDIESFILANADKTYTEQQWERLGIFTGALVSALTQKEKQTTINIDLGNRTFHYLFSWTRYANNIIVKNLTGSDAFEFAGSEQGSIGSITGINIKGHGTFWHAGSNRGRVGNITGINITGNGAFGWAGSHQGSVESTTGINITGNNAFWGDGSHKGNIESITGIKITGDYAFWRAGSDEGSIESITGINIIGNAAFESAGSDAGSLGIVRYYDIIELNSFVDAEIHKKALLTPQQAEKYIEIVNAYKSNDEIQRMIEQLNLVGGEA